MRGSKALKGSWSKIRGLRKNKPKSKFMKIVDAVWEFILFKIYYNAESLINRYIERTRRSLAYARFGWLNYDFDSGFAVELLSWKFKRVLECLINGHAIQEKENLDALRETIKILNRLHEDRYDNKYYREIDKKWGPIKSKHIPIEFDEKGKPTMYRWETSRRKVKTKADKRGEIKDLRRTWKMAAQDRLNDWDRLSELFKKYERTWWD